MKCFKYIIVLAIALLIYNPDDTYALSTIYVDTGSTEYNYSTNSGYYEADAGDYLSSNQYTQNDSLYSCMGGYGLQFFLADYYYNGFDGVILLPNFMKFLCVYDETGTISIYAIFTKSDLRDYCNGSSNKIYWYYGAVIGDSSRVAFQNSNSDLKPSSTSFTNLSSLFSGIFNSKYYNSDDDTYIYRCDFDYNNGNTDLANCRVYSSSDSAVHDCGIKRSHLTPFYLAKRVCDINMPKVYVPASQRLNLDYNTVNYLRNCALGQFDDTSISDSIPSVSSAVLDSAGTLTISRSDSLSNYFSTNDLSVGDVYLKIEGTFNFNSCKTNQVNTVSDTHDGDDIFISYNDNIDLTSNPITTGYGVLDVWFTHTSNALEPNNGIRLSRYKQLINNGYNSSYDYRTSAVYHCGVYGNVSVSPDADYIRDRVNSDILNSSANNLSAPFIRLGLVAVPYINLDCNYDVNSYYKTLYQYCGLIALMSQKSPVVQCNSFILKLSYVHGNRESSPAYLVFANNTSYFFDEQNFLNAGFVNPDFVNVTAPYTPYAETTSDNSSALGSMLYSISINNNINGGGSGGGSASGGTASAIGINGDVNNSSSVGDINITVPNSSSAGSSSSSSSSDVIPFSFSPDAGIWTNLKNGISSGFGLLGNDGTVDTLSNVFRWFDPQGVLKGVLLTGLMLCIVIGIIKFVKP